MTQESTEASLAVLLAPGNVVAGKYRITRVSATARTSVVLEARHLELDRPAALAVMRVGVAAPEQIARFLEHARAVARIQSEHVARVLDIGELPDGCPFVAMDELTGDDLAQLLETRGPLDPEEAVDLMLQALEAPAAAHAVGVLHREIQPANLLVSRGVVHVLDFRAAHEAVDLSPYTAPELVRDPGLLDPRSDVWSVGAVLYELLAGVAPFSGAPEALGAAILGGSPRDLTELRWEVPGALAAVVMRCLQRDPAARHPDVDDLAVALAPFGSGAQAPSVARAQAALAAPPRAEEPPPATPRMQALPVVPAPEPHAPEPGFAGAGSLSGQIVAPVAAADPPNQTTYSGIGAQVSAPPIAMVSLAPVKTKARGSRWARNTALVAAGVAVVALAGFVSTQGLRRGHAGAAAASPPPAVTAVPPVVTPDPAAEPAEPAASATAPADADDPASSLEPAGSSKPAHRGWNRRQILHSRE